MNWRKEMIKPQRDLLKVLVQEKETNRRTESGIYLPDDLTEGPKDIATGEVVDVGPGYVNVNGVTITSPYSVGQVVMFKNHGLLDKVFDGGHHYLLVPSAEVCALVV